MTEPLRRPNRPAVTLTQTYDGDGQRVKYVQNSAILYEIRSSVFGGRVVSEVHGQGVQTKGFVYANGSKLARQTFNEVTWVHEAPDGTGEWESNGIAMRSLELDPLGDDVGVDNPYDSGGDGLGSYPNNGDPTDFQMGCAVDGSTMPCEIVGKFFIKIASRVQVIGAGVRVPIYEWVLNPDEAPGDWCKDGICPPGDVTVHDTGGHFEIAGYNIFNNTPAMRPIIGSDRRARENEYAILRQEMEKALQSEKCRNFIDALISFNQQKNYNSEKDFLAHSDATFRSAEGGVFFRPGYGGGGITALHPDDYRKIFIPTGPSLDQYPRLFDLNYQQYAETLMHELIHTLTTGADDRLDRDLRDLGITPIGRDGKPLPFPTGKRDGKNFNDWSGYWDTALKAACFPKL